MKQYSRLLALGLGLAMLGGLGAITTSSSALAQAADAPPPHGRHEGPGREGDWSPAKHIEGHLAFLHAELAITQAQEPQWQAVAQAMRADAKRMDESFAKMHADRDKPKSAIDHLQAEQAMMTIQSQAVGDLLAALKPLYASFTDQQKKTADELFGHPPHHGPMHEPM
jgi:protein CpxP